MARNLELLDIGIEDIRRELEERLDRDSLVALCIEAGADESAVTGLDEGELIELFLAQGDLDELMNRLLGMPLSESASPSDTTGKGVDNKTSETADTKDPDNESDGETVGEELDISAADLKDEMANYWSYDDLSEIAAQFNLDTSSSETKDTLIELLIAGVPVNDLVAELMSRESEQQSTQNESSIVAADDSSSLSEEIQGSDLPAPLSEDTVHSPAPAEQLDNEETGGSTVSDGDSESEDIEPPVSEQTASDDAEVSAADDTPSSTDDAEIAAAVEPPSSADDDDMAILKQMRAFRSTIPEDLEEDDPDAYLDSDEDESRGSVGKALLPLLLVAAVGAVVFIKVKRPVLFDELKGRIIATGKQVADKVKGFVSNSSSVASSSATSSTADSTGLSAATTAAVTSVNGTVDTAGSGDSSFIIVKNQDSSTGDGSGTSQAVTGNGQSQDTDSETAVDNDTGQTDSGRNLVPDTNTDSVSNGSIVDNSGDGKTSQLTNTEDTTWAVPENKEMIVGTAFKRVGEAFANPDQRIDVFEVASNLSKVNDTVKEVCRKILETESGFPGPLDNVTHYMAKNDWKKAEKACLKSLWSTKRGEERSFAYMLLARIRTEKARPDIALKTYKLALKENPGNELAVLGIYRSYVSLHSPVKAESEVKKFLAKHPSLLLNQLINPSADETDIPDSTSVTHQVVSVSEEPDKSTVTEPDNDTSGQGSAAVTEAQGVVPTGGKTGGTVVSSAHDKTSGDAPYFKAKPDATNVSASDSSGDGSIVSDNGGTSVQSGGALVSVSVSDSDDGRNKTVSSDSQVADSGDNGEVSGVVTSVLNDLNCGTGTDNGSDSLSGSPDDSDTSEQSDNNENSQDGKNTGSVAVSSVRIEDITGAPLEELLLSAKKNESNHKYATAVVYYQAALEKELDDSKRGKVLLDLAFCYRVQKQYDKALESAKKAEKLGAKINPGFWVLLHMQ